MADDLGQMLLYEEGGIPRVEVTLRDGSMWLTQAQMADLFQIDQSGIARHIRNIVHDGELPEDSNMQKMHITNIPKPVTYYSLDMIISVGFRVNSIIGTRFRIWAHQRLNEYVTKGFAIDDARLAGTQTNYFDELVERVRKIRTSEQNFYLKVRDIFATSIDYDSHSPIAGEFFATMQNKFHYAAHGHTAAEVIAERVDASKPLMGLQSYTGKNITLTQATTAKNYLYENEMKSLELLVEQFLSFAELQCHERKPMHMQDWKVKLDEFFKFNDRPILRNAGKMSNRTMTEKARAELAIFNRQTKLPASSTAQPMLKKLQN